MVTLGEAVYQHTMDITLYIACFTRPRLDFFLFADDNAKRVDFRSVILMMHPGICRFFIKYILTDEQLHHMGTFWANRFEVMLHHTCPLCKHGVGTPIDYVMICSETKQYTEAMCDAVNNSIAKNCVVPEQHFAIADT